MGKTAFVRMMVGGITWKKIPKDKEQKVIFFSVRVLENSGSFLQSMFHSKTYASQINRRCTFTVHRLTKTDYVTSSVVQIPS
jgi:hypothetical protein